VALPGVLSTVPEGQVVQGVQLAAFTVVLNEPLAQAEHERSVVVVPDACSNCPAEQFVQFTHAVAAFAS
jgi:hypothetical protein